MSLIIIFVLSRSDSNLISTNATKGLLLELVVKLKQLLEHGYFQKFITVSRCSFFLIQCKTTLLIIISLLEGVPCDMTWRQCLVMQMMFRCLNVKRITNNQSSFVCLYATRDGDILMETAPGCRQHSSSVSI